MSLPPKEQLDRLRTVGDEEADRFVGELTERLGGLSALADTLTAVTRWYDIAGPAPRGIPADVEAFIRAPAPPPPDWLGPETIKRAQRLFHECRYAGLVVLACASLPACYAQPNVATVLSASGRLVNGVRRRLQETVYFTSTVMKPGSLETGGAGLLWIRKVRLMHAMMRPLSLANPGDFQNRTGDDLADLLLRHQWQEPGVAPVNQVELAYVLLTFSWLTLRGWAKLGIRLSEQERTDFILAWAWIGRLLGVTDPLLGYALDTGNEVDGGRRLFEHIRKLYERGTEGGRLLVATLSVVLVDQQSSALRNAIIPSLPGWLAALANASLQLFPRYTENCTECMPRTLIRDLAGLPTATQLRVGRAPFLYWLPGWLLNKAVHWKSLAQEDVPVVQGGNGRQRGAYPGMGRLIEEFIRFDRGSMRY